MKTKEALEASAFRLICAVSDEFSPGELGISARGGVMAGPDEARVSFDLDGFEVNASTFEEEWLVDWINWDGPHVAVETFATELDAAPRVVSLLKGE